MTKKAMTSKAFWAGALASAALAIAACQPHYGTGVGQIGVGAQFPQTGFRTLVIPATTASIAVTVSGEGMETALSLTLTPTSPKTVITVPAGPKTVSATARDATGKTLAQASSAVTVIGGGKTTAILDLLPAPEASPSPEPSSQPTPGPSSGPGTTEPGTPPSADPQTTPSTVPAPTGVTSTPAPTPTPTPPLSAFAEPSPGAQQPADVQLTVNDGATAPAMAGQDL